jgi:hypothetical protein
MKTLSLKVRVILFPEKESPNYPLLSVNNAVYLVRKEESLPGLRRREPALSENKVAYLVSEKEVCLLCKEDCLPLRRVSLYPVRRE